MAIESLVVIRKGPAQNVSPLVDAQANTAAADGKFVFVNVDSNTGATATITAGRIGLSTIEGLVSSVTGGDTAGTELGAERPTVVSDIITLPPSNFVWSLVVFGAE